MGYTSDLLCGQKGIYRSTPVGGLRFYVFFFFFTILVKKLNRFNIFKQPTRKKSFLNMQYNSNYFIMYLLDFWEFGTALHSSPVL